MGVQERRERQKESLRQEILDAARELFVREGYDSVSMRRIAEKIEYSPTTIYLYFRDKSDLLNQLCEETFAKLARTLDRISRAQDDPLTALRRGLRAYVDFGLKHPHHYEVTFIMPIMQYVGPDEHPYEGSVGEQAFNYLRSAVGAAMAENKIRRGDVDLTSQALWAGVHGVTSLLIGHSDFPWVSRNKLIDHLIDTMIEGLKP